MALLEVTHNQLAELFEEFRIYVDENKTPTSGTFYFLDWASNRIGMWVNSPRTGIYTIHGSGEQLMKFKLTHL